MAKSGPKPSCNCNDFINCQTCRRRERTRLHYHGEKLPTLPTWGIPRESRIAIPRDERFVAYLAGLFDGEGCITENGQGHYVAQIGMTDETVIRWVAQVGGTVRIEDGPNRGNRKPLYRWRLTAANDVQAFLRAIHPYLIVKQAAAENAIVAIDGRQMVKAGAA
jgi:hypothetical protein